MKLNQAKAKNSAIAVGAGAVGIVAASKIGKVLQDKAPDAIKKHVPLILTAAGVILPAVVDIKSDAAVAALHGMSIGGAIQAINGFSVDETGALATEGVKGFLAKTVPQLSGVSGLGNLPVYEYTETANNLMLAGSYEAPAPVYNPMALMAG